MTEGIVVVLEDVSPCEELSKGRLAIAQVGQEFEDQVLCCST
jgi:hypothetical protein